MRISKRDKRSFTMFTPFLPVKNAGESFEGTIQMKGDKFTLVTPDALTWFNGTTQWDVCGTER